MSSLTQTLRTIRRRAVPAMIATLAFLTVLSFSYLTLLAPSADAAAPTFSIEGRKDGNSKLRISFDDGVHNGSFGDLEASDFTVGGTDGLSLTGVSHTAGTPDVILSFDGAVNISGAGEVTIACASSAVSSLSNELCTQGATDLNTVSSDSTGPAVLDVSLIDSTTVYIEFDEFIDSGSISPGAITFSTADGGDNENVDNANVGNTGTDLTASGAVVAFGDTISVTSTVTDIFGNASAGETVKIYPSLKISEVKIGSSANSKDEFIELYNVGGQPISANDIFLHLYNQGSTTDSNMTLTKFNTTIQPNGYYLISTSFFDTVGAGVSADATYSAGSAQLVSNGAAYISLSATADTDVIDKVGWGTSAKKEGTALADISADTSVERKAKPTSTVSSMRTGSPALDVFSGNSEDTNNNVTDFVVQTAAVPQSTQSTSEFAAGFGSSEAAGGDAAAPTVIDSWPNSSAANFVDANLSIVGIDFSEQMSGPSLTTSNISLIVDSDPGTNLCSSINYNPTATFGAQVECVVNPSALPLANVAHTLTVNTSVTDTSNNGLASNYVVNFTPQPSTGDNAFSFQSTSPPVVVGTFPKNGSSSFPPDGELISVNFNESIDSSSLANNITLRDVTNSFNNLGITGASLRTIVDTNDSLEVDISGITLVAGNEYELLISQGLSTADNVPMTADYSFRFTTAASNDGTGPLVTATEPSNGQTGVEVGATLITVSLDDALDSSVITSGAGNIVDLKQGSDSVPITTKYKPSVRELHIISSTPFEPSTAYTVNLLAAGSGSTLNNISGIALQDTDGTSDNVYRFSFTTGSADTVNPEASFAVVTESTAKVTFSELMLKNDVTDLSNWTMTSNGVTQPLSSLAGNTVSWDESTMTATLKGFSVPPGETFVLTPSSGMRDLSGNQIGSTIALGGAVQSGATCDFCNGTDAGFQDNYWETPTEFSDFGFMMPASVFPMNQMAGFVSNYMVDFAITEQIRATGNNGKIVLTFPKGFDVTNAAVESDSNDNNDINGFGSGTVGIASVTANKTARTVTIKLDTATRCGSGNVDPCASGDEDDFLHFDLSGIVNSSVPRDWNSSMYTVDIKLMTGTTLNESYTSMPFPINAAGTDSLLVDVTAGSENSGTLDVHLFCPSTGDMVQAVNFATEGDGTAQTTFAGLPSGEYCNLWTEEKSLTIGAADDYVGIEYIPVVISGSTTENVTLAATSGLQAVTVELTGVGSKKVDVEAHRVDGYDFARKTVTTTTGTDSATLKLGDGTWEINVWPAMPKTGGWSQPPIQDYTVTPNRIKIVVANPNVTESSGTADDGTVSFALSGISNSVTASVVDTSNKVMAGASVFLDSTNGGYGTGSQTGIEGKITLSANPGTYRMGAFLPGAPPSRETTVRIDSAGNVYQDGSTSATTNVIIEISKGSQAITGTVTDGTNPVSGASVHAFCTANCNGYFDAHANTGSNGTYSLYVGTGTWTVDAYSPGYGPLGSTSVTVTSGVDTSNTDFQPNSNTTFRTISGTICKKAGAGANCTSGTGLGGIEIWAHSESAGGGSNFGRTKDDGTYSIRVPSAEGYKIEPFDPARGPLPPISNIDASAGNVTSKDSVIDVPKGVSVAIEDSLGNAVSVNDMFIEFVDDTQDMRQTVFIEGESSGSIDLADGTYEIELHMKGSSIEPDTDIAGAGVTTGTLVVDGAETITVTVPDLSTVSGTLTDGSAAVESAYVELTSPATGAVIGTTTDSSGNYSVAVPDGTYQVTAYNPGLVLPASSVTVSGANETKNMTGSVTDQSISGTISDPNGNAVPYAFVVAEKSGGGTVAVQADGKGVYTAYVEDGDWSISASGHGYTPKAKAATVSIDGASSASNDVAFTATSAALANPVTQSFTPSNGGVVKDTGTGGSGVSVQIPANSLSTSTSAGTVSVKETNNAVSTSTTSVIGDAFEVTAQDAGGNQLTSDFSSKVTLEQCQSAADLATDGIDTLAEAKALTISYFAQNGTWINETTVATFKDGSADTVAAPASNLSNVAEVCFKSAVDHFTVFSITAPADGVAPAVPTGVAANGNGSGVTVTWNAVTTNADTSSISDLAGYEIYRDTTSGGSFSSQLNSSDISGTSYTDTTAATGTTYYYKVTAADTGGLESSKSSAVSGMKSSGGVNIGTSGGGGGVSVPQTSISVLTPDGNAILGGTNYNATWTITGNATDVDVYASYDSGTTYSLVASGQNANQGYLWAVPNVNTETAMIRVDVRNGGEVLASGTSAVFSITADQLQDIVTVDSVSSPDPVSELFPSKDEAEASLPDDLDAGFLVKAPGLPAVYFLGGDGKRHSFPNETTYFSWFGDFSEVREISVSKMASISLGEPVRVRPGTWMIKIQSDPKTYAVEPGGTIRWVQTETVATDLFGANWNKRIVDVEPTMFSNYSTGAPLSNSNEHPAGMVVRDGSGHAHYLAEDGTLRQFANEAAVRANFIQTRFERPARAGDIARTAGVLINNIEDILFRYQDIGR